MPIISTIDVYLDIELRGCIFLVLDINAPLTDIILACLDSLWTTVFQHFKTVRRFTNSSPQCDSYGQAHHTCARYTDTHCIFQNISTKQDFDTLGASAKFLGRSGHSQCDTNRFGASHGWYDLLPDECNDLLSLLVCQRGILGIIVCHFILIMLL